MNITNDKLLTETIQSALKYANFSSHVPYEFTQEVGINMYYMYIIHVHVMHILYRHVMYALYVCIVCTCIVCMYCVYMYCMYCMYM